MFSCLKKKYVPPFSCLKKKHVLMFSCLKKTMSPRSLVLKKLAKRQ